MDGHPGRSVKGTSMHCTDEKKPTGDGNPTAGGTDHAIISNATSAGKKARHAPAKRLLALYATINFVLVRAWCVAPSSWARGTIRSKAKAPARRNAFGQAVAAPTDKRGFVMPRFWGQCVCTALWFRGVVGVIRKDARTACPVFLTATLHPTRVETRRVVLKSRQGATMSASPVASCSAAPAPTTSEAQAFALLQATSDATMAKLYLSQGNIPAARRKAVQLLKALQGLSKFERAQVPTSPCTGCRDNFPLPEAADFFDRQVVADYVTCRTACTLRPQGDKPCLQKGGTV